MVIPTHLLERSFRLGSRTLRKSVLIFWEALFTELEETLAFCLTKEGQRLATLQAKQLLDYGLFDA